jgi:hypothetical protein
MKIESLILMLEEEGDINISLTNGHRKELLRDLLTQYELLHGGMVHVETVDVPPTEEWYYA